MRAPANKPEPANEPEAEGAEKPIRQHKPFCTVAWATTVAGACLALPWLPEASFALDAIADGRLSDFATEPQTCASLLAFALTCACMLAAMSWARMRGNVVQRGYVEAACLALTGIGAALYAMSDAAGEATHALGVVFGCCLGAASACAATLWKQRFSALNDTQIAAGILVAASVWCLAFNLARLVQPDTAAALGFIATLGSSLLAWKSTPVETPAPVRPHPGSGSPLFNHSVRMWNVRLVGVCFLVGFSFSTMLYIFTTTTGRGEIEGTEWSMLFAGLPVCLLCLAAGWVRNHELDFMRSLRFSCIVAIPAFFPLKVGTYALRFAFDFTAIALVAILCILAMLLASNERFLNGLQASSAELGPTGASAGIAAGTAFALLFVRRGPLGEDMVYFSGLISLVCVFVATNTMLSPNTLLSIERIATGRFPAHVDAAEKLVGATDNVGAPANALARICKELALETCLTDRETEVLMILARGSSLARVQEDLLISEGTAITHRNHVYRKLGVHSKQELIDLIDRRLGAD